MNDQKLQDRDWLLDKGQIIEQPFHSNVPLFGPLIAWLRTLWNSMAAKWYVRPMLAQQNEYNRLLVDRLRDVESYTYELTAEQDRDLGQLRHDVAVLHLQLRNLNRQLEELNDRLGQLDDGEEPGSEGEIV